MILAARWNSGVVGKMGSVFVTFDLGLENRVLDLASHSLSDRRWGVSVGQPMRHLLSQMFQQQINSAMLINSSITYVSMHG